VKQVYPGLFAMKLTQNQLSRNLREDWVLQGSAPVATKHNITLAIDGTLLKRARAVAARRGLSVSALLAEELRVLVAEDREYESARRRAVAMLDEGLSLGGLRIADRGALHERHRVR
jgi:hypothetical protein